MALQHTVKSQAGGTCKDESEGFWVSPPRLVSVPMVTRKRKKDRRPPSPPLHRRHQPSSPSLSFEGTSVSHDIHKEFTRVAHGFLERLTAPGQLGRDGAQFAHGRPAGRPTCPVDFGAQLREVVERGHPWRPVRMVATGAPLAGGGRGVAAVAKLAGRPLPPQDAAPSPTPGGVIRFAAAAADGLAVLLPIQRPPAVLAVASVGAAAFASWEWGGKEPRMEERNSG